MPTDEESKVRDELRRRKTAQWKGRIGGHGDNPDKGVIDRVNQIDATAEEHVYLISETLDGGQLLWEADLLGDRSPDQGHGRLPVMIHLLCPYCSTPKDPRAISIDFQNKRFEIEHLKVPKTISKVVHFDGTEGPFDLWDLLSVTEPLQCPYYEDVEGERCGARFTIRGGLIQRFG